VKEADYTSALYHVKGEGVFWEKLEIFSQICSATPFQNLNRTFNLNNEKKMKG
jgi:hypothetical protein